jgi:four helix bundle protein
MDLVTEVYNISKQFPKDEAYGLTSQLRRAALSIPSNVAEGHGRNGPREFVHHLSIAHGSLSEVETQLEIARRLGYVDEEKPIGLNRIAGETGKLINGLMNSLRKHAN